MPVGQVMLTRLGSYALRALGYNNNDELEKLVQDKNQELDDATVTKNGWVFVRKKRPVRTCSARLNTKEEDEGWVTVGTSTKRVRSLNLPQSEERVGGNKMADHVSRGPPDTRYQHSVDGGVVDIVLTNNQRRLMSAAAESKSMLDRGLKTKRLQHNTTFGCSARMSKKQMKHQNRMISQTMNNERGRKRHMVATRYSGKAGRRAR